MDTGAAARLVDIMSDSFEIGSVVHLFDHPVLAAITGVVVAPTKVERHALAAIPGLWPSRYVMVEWSIGERRWERRSDLAAVAPAAPAQPERPGEVINLHDRRLLD